MMSYMKTIKNRNEWWKMDWIKFERAKSLKEVVNRVRHNVYFAENYSAIKLGLYDVKNENK